MNKEAQRIAIHEARGFRFEKFATNPPRLINPAEQLEHVPDYLNDLNAMHEAEKTLSETERREYVGGLMGAPDCDFIFATAALRAEEFLKAKGLWKEEEVAA